MTNERSLNFVFDESKLSDKPIPLYLNGKEVGSVRKIGNEVKLVGTDVEVEKLIESMITKK